MKAKGTIKRPKNESKEEKKARKQEVKAERQVRDSHCSLPSFLTHPRPPHLSYAEKRRRRTDFFQEESSDVGSDAEDEDICVAQAFLRWFAVTVALPSAVLYMGRWRWITHLDAEQETVQNGPQLAQ